MKNKFIQFKRRATVVKTHLNIKASYLAGTWTGLTVADASRVHSGVMGVYRALADQDRPVGAQATCTDFQMIQDLEVLFPLSLVVYENISTFVRTFVKANPPLMLVLAHAYTTGSEKGRSWLSEMHRVLTKLAESSDQLEELRDATIAQWIACVRNHPRSSLKL